MTKEIAFLNVKGATRELSANADTHEKLNEALMIIEQIVFPERFEKKENEKTDSDS